VSKQLLYGHLTKLDVGKNFTIMVIVHEYPINYVTNNYLRVFLKSLQPEFKLVSRNNIRYDCINIYEEERQILYEMLGKLDCKVSLVIRGPII
jgi:hypothetical protein